MTTEMELPIESERSLSVEIEAARKAGKPWTDYRPFRSRDEQLGALKCGGLRCHNDSNVVSYGTVIDARTALCSECLRDRTQWP